MNEDFTGSLEAAIADYRALRPPDQKWCKFFWGSHGCSLPEGEHTVHLCADPEYDDEMNVIGTFECCQYDEERPPEARVRSLQQDDTWGEWQAYGEGWRQ